MTAHGPSAPADPRAAVDAVLPTVIGRSELEGPVLLLGGDGWTMSVLGTWRWTTPAGAVVDEQSPEVADEIWNLTGETITSASWSRPTDYGLDPSLHLRSGGRIDVVSDASFDTWQISLPDTVLVGPLVDGAD